MFGTLASTQLAEPPLWVARIAALLTLAFGFFTVVRGTLLWRIAAVLGVGAGSEILGMYTGYPFGRYEYTEAWWPTVPMPGDHRFPLLLPFAWAMIAGGCARWLHRRPIWLIGLAAAAVDLVMEPVMVQRLEYWRWLDGGPLPGGVPLLNFIGWFLVSTAAAWLLGESDEAPCEAGWVLVGHLALVSALWFAG